MSVCFVNYFFSGFFFCKYIIFFLRVYGSKDKILMLIIVLLASRTGLSLLSNGPKSGRLVIMQRLNRILGEFELTCLH